MSFERTTNNQYDNKLNGYRPSHKNKWLLLKHKILTLNELSLYDFYIDISDFDINHRKFGTFEVNYEEIAEYFDRKSGAIRLWHKGLKEKGFIKKIKKNVYEIACPDRYITPGWWQGKAAYYAKLEKNQSIETILKNLTINFQSVEKNLQNFTKYSYKSQTVTTKTAPIAIGSFKDIYKDRSIKSNIEYPLFVSIEQEPRTEKEYQSMCEKYDSELLTTEDLRWLDENMKEKVRIEDENELKEAIETFCGDLNDEFRV